MQAALRTPGCLPARPGAPGFILDLHQRVSIGAGSGRLIGLKKGSLERVVQVVHGRDPCVTRRASTSDKAARVGDPCLPTVQPEGAADSKVRIGHAVDVSGRTDELTCSSRWRGGPAGALESQRRVRPARAVRVSGPARRSKPGRFGQRHLARPSHPVLLLIDGNSLTDCPDFRGHL